MRILVAEDDASLADVLLQQLEHEKFAVELVSDGEEAVRRASAHPYDLALLDLSVSGSKGLDILKGIRLHQPDLPVLMVAGAEMIDERVQGLDAGADDYVAKPFVFTELAARMRAILRRGHRRPSAVLHVDDLELDRLSRAVRRGNHNIELSPKEFALLEYLMRHVGQPVPRAAIVEEVWKINFGTMTNVVDVYINYLRRKVDTEFSHPLIRTIRGVGYQIGGNGRHVPPDLTRSS